MLYKKIKEAYKIHNNAFGYMQRIKALLNMFDNDEAEYPSNFLLTIAKRDLKSANKKLSKSLDILRRAKIKKELF